MSNTRVPDALWLISVEKYTNAALLTISVYELLAAFSLEVSLIWKAPWNIPKVLYICSRYLPLASFSLLLYYDSFQKCKTYAVLSIWTVSITVCISEVIFTLRTWAAWNRDRIMGIFLCLLFLSIWVVNLTFAGRNITKGLHIEPASLYFCIFHLPDTLWPSFGNILVATFYTITLPLMLIKAYQQLFRSGERTRLMQIFYFDGIFYYACLLILSWMNFAFTAGHFQDASVVLSFLLPRLQQTFCSVFACRMTLNLREYGRRTARGLDSQLGEISGFTVHMDPLLFNYADLGLAGSEDGISLHEIRASRTQDV